MRMLLVSFVLVSSFVAAFGGDLTQDVEITWGDGRGKLVNNGELLTLSLDQSSGSGFRSRDEYLFGEISMQLKLVAGNSAGTVTTFYRLQFSLMMQLSSSGEGQDEIDFEFLGNLSADPITVHTNVFVQGKGNKEQQFHLWFDPTLDFHTYTILWNPTNIIWSVDGVAIRVFKNSESIGVLYPKNKAMRVYSSLWNADDWATRGGLVKTDWSKAPFTASYRNFSAKACIWSSGTSSCTPGSPSLNSEWMEKEIDSGHSDITWVQKNYVVYNYCSDVNRFPQGLPAECKVI